MKNNKIIKKLAFALATLMVFAQLFTLVPFAANGVPTEWSFSEDQEYLTNETQSVTYHNFFNGVALRPDSSFVFVYEQSIEYADMPYLSVHANPDYPEAVWISLYDGYEIFVTDDGEKNLLAFTEGKTGRFFLENEGGERADFDRETVEMLDAELREGSNTKTFDVKDIKPSGNFCKVYNIVAQDESKTFAYTYGAIYSFMNGEKWYVNYSDLDNNYFDANGYFSYRRGSVKMTRISDDAEIVKAIDRMIYYDVMYEYEWTVYDEELGNADQTFFMVVFWIVYVAVFIIPAAVIMVIGAVLPSFKKLGKPKYWYSVVLLAAFWLLAAIALAGYLIIITLI